MVSKENTHGMQTHGILNRTDVPSQKEFLVDITPLLPDGFEGAIKRLTCTFCKRQFYVSQAYFVAHQPTHCHECSEVLAPRKPKRPLTVMSYPETEEELHKEGLETFFTFPHHAFLLFDRACQQFPNNPINHYYVALFLQRQKEYEKAIERCNTAIQHDTTFAAAYSLIGDCLYKQDNYQQALLYYEKAITLDPQEMNAYVGKGEVYCTLSDFNAAFTWYEKAIALFPDVFYAYEKKIQLLSLLQKKDEVERIYTTFLAAHPDNLEATQRYALFLVRNHRKQESLQMRMKAGELRKKR